jgi:hypothetical protein
MNLGAEPKKIAILGGLVLVGGYVFYANVLAGPETPPSAAKSAAKQQAAATSAAASSKSAPQPPNIRRAKTSVRSGASQEFKPTVVSRPEDRPDYTKIDPTLRLDLLAKVQAAPAEGGGRRLFQFAAAPAPKPVEVATAIKPAPRMYGPEPPPKPVPPPPPPPPPAITLKFYGFSNPRADGQKRAFFMDGEDIFIAAEGELVKKRYRVVKIDATSVVMEDTEFKNNRQTLAIQPEQAG